MIIFNLFNNKNEFINSTLHIHCRAMLRAGFMCIFLCISLTFIKAYAISPSIPLVVNKNKSNTPLTIAVASNFAYTLEQLISSSDYWSQQNLRIVTGSSGTLYSQITRGAPFDVFLSADNSRPIALEKSGMAVNKRIYAKGRLVLWFPSWVNLSNQATSNINEWQFKQLLANYEGKLAIANPRLAPYGYAAMEVLKNVASLNYLTKQLVMGANVNQAFQFVDSGNARAGLIAQSILIQAKNLTEQSNYANGILIPDDLHSPIEQSLVILNPHNPHTLAYPFVDFLLNKNTQSTLQQYGYISP